MNSNLRPLHLLAVACASTSIGSLLLYFAGYVPMGRGVMFLLLPATVLLAGLTAWDRTSGDGDLSRRVLFGLWAGGFATLAYDVVRVPLPYLGLPVFKAISYFGTVILGEPHPTLVTEIAGWSYHLSNGIGFAIMYALLFRRPGPITAVLWGVFLEIAMLLTPYAEVFGYKRDARFLAITVGAHVVYGLVMWIALRPLAREASPPAPEPDQPFTGLRRFAFWLLGPLVVLLVGVDFYRQFATAIPPSPPPDIGRDLLVTWSNPEPDRVGAIWLMKRFVQPNARFHFVEPMTKVVYGTPFDLPEAEIRRTFDQSTFEVVLARTGRGDEPAMQLLASMCHLTEITPWALASAPRERELAEQLNARIAGCKRLDDCLPEGLAWYDEAYARLKDEPR